jgi:subtilisin family serine protease
MPRTAALPAEPEDVPPFPRRQRRADSVNVVVLDTGLKLSDGAMPLRAEHPMLQRAVELHRSTWRRDCDPIAADDDDEKSVDGDELLDLQAGHGTFVAGIVRRLAPAVTIHVDGVLSSFGDGDDLSAGEGLRRAISRIGDDQPTIVNMSFGAYTDGDLAPPLAAYIADLDRDHTLVVAGAGNGSSSRAFYPAALPGVVGVGALDARGPAWFSNYGGWVDACAPGVDVVSTFFTDHVDEFGDPPGSLRHEYRGWARWSGTSFAAPKVAAAIAREAQSSGVSPVEAWGRLSHWSKLRMPDLGVVFNER